MIGVGAEAVSSEETSHCIVNKNDEDGKESILINTLLILDVYCVIDKGIKMVKM